VTDALTREQVEAWLACKGRNQSCTGCPHFNDLDLRCESAANWDAYTPDQIARQLLAALDTIATLRAEHDAHMALLDAAAVQVEHSAMSIYPLLDGIEASRTYDDRKEASD
jgi:hypothetical protein